MLCNLGRTRITPRRRISSQTPAHGPPTMCIRCQDFLATCAEPAVHLSRSELIIQRLNRIAPLLVDEDPVSTAYAPTDQVIRSNTMSACTPIMRDRLYPVILPSRLGRTPIILPSPVSVRWTSRGIRDMTRSTCHRYRSAQGTSPYGA